MTTRSLLAIVGLLLALSCACGQEDPTKENPFDAEAEIAALSVMPEPAEFKRLWTSKTRVRLFRGLAISGDGKRVLALTPDGAPVVYDGESGEEISRPERPPELITCTALSPDGAMAAVGLKDGQVITFDVATGKVIHRYAASKDAVEAVGYAAHGVQLSWLDRGGNFGRATVDAPEIDSARFMLQPPAKRLYSFNPAGDRIFAQSGVNEYQILLAAPNANPNFYSIKFKAPPDAVALTEFYLTFYEQGRLVFEGFRRREAPDVPTRRTSSFSFLTADTTAPRALAASSDGKWIIGVGRGQVEIRPIDCSIYSSIHNAEFEIAAQVAVAPNAFRLAVVDQDGYLSVLAPSSPPEAPSWRFVRLLKRLVEEKRYDDLDRLAELIQDDPESFPFEPAVPKYHALCENLLENWNPLEPRPDARRAIKDWLAARPDSTLARVMEVKHLIEEGWAARGTGFVNTVTPQGMETFHLRILEASEKLKPLLEEDEPAPEAIFCMMTVVKAESRDDSERMQYVDKLMAVSPRYSVPHVSSVENCLPRWGGAPHSAARYAGQIADRIGEGEGDALYANLVITVMKYEGQGAADPLWEIDVQRAIKGAEHMQKTPHLRPLGLLYEMLFADIAADEERVTRVVATIQRDKVPFAGGIERSFYEHLYRDYLGR